MLYILFDYEYYYLCVEAQPLNPCCFLFRSYSNEQDFFLLLIKHEHFKCNVNKVAIYVAIFQIGMCINFRHVTSTTYY